VTLCLCGKKIASCIFHGHLALGRENPMKFYCVLLTVYCALQTIFLTGQICGGIVVMNPTVRVATLRPVVIQTNPKVTVDTISSGNRIVLDPAVYSFVACIIIPGGISIERKYNGNALVDYPFLKSGTIIIIDHIMSGNKDGVPIKYPAKKFVVR
jgi:hypothetical protein